MVFAISSEINKYKKAPVVAGVQQGTVLEPFLFLAYINDKPETTTSSETKIFADGSLLYSTINNQARQRLTTERPNFTTKMGE